MMSLGIETDSAHAMGATAPNSSCTVANPTGGPACVNGPVTLTAQEQIIAAKKQALAQEYQNVLHGTVSNATYQSDWQAFIQQYGGPTTSVQASGNGTIPYCVLPCNIHVLRLAQQPQQTTYYCGPAAASEILGVRGVNVSQSTLAGNNYLQTNENGATNWEPYVMGPTLNALTNSSFYATVNGSGVGGGFSVATWESNLQQDINQGWALAGGVAEPVNFTPRLNGHPSSVAIYHWIGIYGYADSGVTTYYADSIAGTSFWTWGSKVPAYNDYSSGDMTTLLNTRGYIW